ncbi:MAG: amidohydrolase family protein [Halieaceae bacterium]
MRLFAIPGILALLLLSACSEKEAGNAADRVFLNGTVYTADSERSLATALAVRGERITYVGDDAGARALIGDDTQVLDLAGRMLIPGLHDMHIHPMGIVEGDGCDLASAVLDLGQIAAAVSECLASQELAAGEWLPVDQWNFSNGNQPVAGLRNLRMALDAAAPDNPVILWGNDGHHGAVNSQALARAVNAEGIIVGISAATLATDFSTYRDTIGVDARGEPNGELHETARQLVQPPPWGIIGGIDAELMPRVAEKLAENGITAIQDAAAPPASLALYKGLLDSGDMSFHFSASLFQDVGDFTDADGAIDVPAMLAELEEIREAYRDIAGIRTETAKIFVDGVIEGNPLNDPPTLPNAAVLSAYKQPQFAIDLEAGQAEIKGYVDTGSELCQQVREQEARYADVSTAAAFRDQHGFFPVQCRISRGVLEHPANFISAYMRALDKAGFKIHAHVIGDRAVRTALDGFEGLPAGKDASGLRHSLGHVQLVAPEDYQRIGDLGLYLVFTYAWINPDFLYDLTVNPFIDELNGVAELYRPDSYYMRNVYPASQLQAAGAVLAAGSDAPVDTREPRPFVNIQQAVTRANSDGQNLNTAARIDVASALDAYTINGARLFGHDADTGSLEAGKYADLVVIDRDLLALEQQGRAAEIAGSQVLTTLFRGRVVYEAE